MKKDLWVLDIKNLTALYEEEKRELEQTLLAGASWEEVVEHRKRLGEISTILYKKSNPSHFGNPAENDSRKDLSR